MHPATGPAKLSLVLLLAGLTACSDGGPGPSPPPGPPPPPTQLSYATPPAYTVNTAIDSLIPTVSGSVTTYAVAPALPAGLAINSLTGVISGTPTAVTPVATYTVSASNVSGSTTFGLSLTVNDMAPAFTYPNASYVFTTGIAIANLVPTSTGGAVVNWSVDRALPDGLTLNPATGVISGTPTSITPAGTYTLAASNATGTTSFSLGLTVNAPAPAFRYPSIRYGFTTGMPSADISPTSSGGAVVSWSINPALPPGLSFDSATGVISGIPGVATPYATYLVTATNTGGDTSFEIELGVSSRVLADLGHGGGILDVKMSGQRMLSADSQGRAVLWNAQSGERLFAQYPNCANCSTEIDLAGAIAVIRHGNALTVLSSTDGAVRATIPLSDTVTWWSLAPDGSYFCAGSNAALYVWSPDGSPLITRLSGNYAVARAFAAPGEVRIATGPAGAQVIEKIAVPSGAQSVTSTFQGEFHSWFLDGNRFFSQAGTNFWIYSSEATQQQLIDLPTSDGLMGRGNRFWTATSALSLYTVGGASPEFTFGIGSLQVVRVAGNMLALLPSFLNRLSILDLDAAIPAFTVYTTTSPPNTFGALSANDWVYGNAQGVLMGEVPATGSSQNYSLGALTALAGNDQRLVYATASGHIFHYDGATLASRGDIAFGARHLSLSDAGTLLLADTAEGDPPRLMRFYELPSESILFERVNDNLPSLAYASLSRSGTVVGDLLDGGPIAPGTFRDYQRRVTSLGGAPIYLDRFSSNLTTSTYPSALMLSPDGVHHADLRGRPDPSAGASIRNGSNLVGAAVGVPIGWADNSRLLVNRLRFDPFGVVEYVGTDIVNLSGQVQSSITLPPGGQGYFQVLAGNRIYSPGLNGVISLTDGSVLWSSGTPTSQLGAVVGNDVVFLSRAEIVVEPF